MDGKMRFTLMTAVALLALTAVAAPATAEDAALLDVTTEGQISGTARARIVEAAERGLAGGQTPSLTSLADTTARLESVAPEILACDEPTCLTRAGQALSARVGYVLHVSEAFDSYTIEATAWDLDSGAELARVDTSCEICTPDEVGAAVEGLANRATSGWTLTPAGTTEQPAISATTTTTDPVDDQRPGRSVEGNVRVAIYADPSDARVLVDGQTMGQGRFVGSLEPGTHEVRIERNGYTTSIKEIELEPGDGTLHMAIDLRPTSTTTTRAVGRTGGAIDEIDREIAAWSLTGGGAVVTIGGIVLLALDGDTNCGGDDATTCPEVFETTAGGAVMLGLGVAALTSGIVLFLWDELAGTPAPEDADAVGFGIAPVADPQRGTLDGGAMWLGGHF